MGLPHVATRESFFGVKSQRDVEKDIEILGEKNKEGTTVLLLLLIWKKEKGDTESTYTQVALREYQLELH